MRSNFLLRTGKSLLGVLTILQYKGGLRAVTTARPRSIASFRLVNSLKLEGVRFNTVIDGGANVGQFARAASTAFPGAKIYSFEPLPDIADKLRRNLADVSGHEVLEKALGNMEGEIEIHRCSDDQSSSVLARAECEGGLLEGTTDVGLQKVSICSLDNVLRNLDVKTPLLVKLDLQGYELEALRGAVETLKQTSYVLVEAVFTKAYQEEPYFEELWSFLKEHGFRFVRPIAFVRDQSDRIVQLDALFQNVSIAIDEE